MQQLELVLALIFVVALSSVLAKLTRISLPLLQVFIGIVLSQVPGFDTINLNPEFFFLLFIPPLLFSDSWLIPKREFFRYKGQIFRLAIILVFVNTLVIGYLVHWLFPGVPLAACFALSAAISPTDAVATTAIIEKFKIPSRITHILNGESLVNDASGLVAFKFAVAAVLTGTFSLTDATCDFVILVIGGVSTGIITAWAIGTLRQIISKRKLTEPSIQVTLSVLTPFAAYLLADYLKFSTILAVVACGIYSGINDTKYMTRDTRIHAAEVWRLLLYLLNGSVFLLLGHTLPKVIADLESTGWHILFEKALLITFCMLVFRLMWVFPSAYLSYWLTKINKRKKAVRPNYKNVFLVGWTGIRGAITLVATLSIPLTLADGSLFPNRELLIFLASVVIITTLLLQNISLPILIKWLNLKSDGIFEKEEQFARIKLLTAAIVALEARLKISKSSDEQNEIARLVEKYSQRLLDLSEENSTMASTVTKTKISKTMRLIAVKAERAELTRLKDTKDINEQVLRVIQRELDYEEAFVRAFKT